MAQLNNKVGILYSSQIQLNYSLEGNYGLRVYFDGHYIDTTIGNKPKLELLTYPIWDTPQEFLVFFISTKLLVSYNVIYTDIFNINSYFETRNKA